ncbi:uncharacterized protein LOC130447506 isoform X1 [Diorhabda sublineata]|uniref:uncharacterized protein LOC130447506 isoform X1 n=1 Tax=Diorhabda sublineata TaxID=1163346 RepID=UPI0024E0D8FE|nr:uncharacterized protein LOC130447506 isoform X1 [Diorhabda sublineata]
MDPVLQRLGDVTIQRLEKPREPKMGPQNVPVAKPKENKDEMNSSPEDDSGDDFSIPGLKRSMVSNEISMKKFKFGPSGLPIGKKTDDLSETEMSDYDSESEMEDSEDESHELNTNAPLNQKVTPNKNFPVPQLPIQAPSNSDEDEGSSGASFFEKLVQQTTVTEPPPSNMPDSNTPKEPNIPIKQEAASEEDYDIDIKEKLKEMGEISFETVKKGEKPKKTEVVENEVVVTTKKLGADGEEIPGLPKGIALRRNIREVMDETKLDESTLAAQRQEVERLRRVQEQQRLLRELQKQAAQERMQNRVISLLQGGHYSKPGTSQQTRIGNTVLVKLPNGQTKPMTRIPKRPFELLRYQKKVAQQPMSAPKVSKNLLPPKKIPTGPDLTPSVSIAPVSKKMMPPIMQRHSDSDSESDERKIMSPPLTHKPKGKPPVQTIDISSDDDCIVVSEPEEEEEETEDDPTNSGMHTNDQFNQPDEQGRVLVNVGHPEGEPDVFVAPQISRIIKPHQIGGVRFLYDNVVESTSRFESSTGFGCILAHSMGLGKTLQIVTFSDIFLRHTSAKTILCIMPINTLQNWMAEYNMWIPPEESVASSPLAAHGEVRPRNFNILVLNDSHKTLVARAKVIHEWRTNGGVLLIGYEQFRLLSQRKMPKSRRKVNPEIDDNRNSKLFDEVHTALIKPGPDLVICDEGHRIKNSHASISQALKQMETKRRVVLTGYPLQNNLMEYWCMVDFVRPNYLGSKTEFCNMFERPIMNGQCIDSTEADIKLMRYRAHVLHSLLIGFVQRRSHAVLQTALPQKEEYVLLVRMTPFQRTLYETFMNEVVRVQAVPNPLKAFAVCCKIWNHPDVLYNFLKKRAGGEAVDIDLEEVGGAPITKTANEKPPPKSKRKTPAKGKNGKPAASVTPYNSSTEGAGTPLVQSVSTAPTTTFSSTSPITSFANALSQQSKIKAQQCTSSQDSTTIQDISNNFPDTILQPYYDQEFDQNAQFPSTFPNSNNYNYPNTSNANTDYNSSFNLSEHTQKTSFLNLDSQNSTLTPLSSKVSLTPLTSKTKDLSLSGNSTLTPLNNMNNSLNTTSALTPLKNACNMLNSVGSVPDGVNNNMQPSSEDIMEIGCSGNGNNPVFGQDRQRNYNIENNTNFQNEYNYQQNYWNQPQQHENTTSYDNQHSDYFGPPNNQFNPHLTNSTSSWMKKEDLKPNVSNMINLKNEISNENKPKINIISDIKLPPVFSTATTTTSMDKKINIISDIKIEPKIEEGVDVYDVKPNVLPPLPSLTPFKTEFKNEFQSDIKTEFKNEIKNEDEHKDEKPQLPTPVQENPFSKLNPLALKDSKEDSGIPYDWAIELLQDYKPGCIENSAKMGILFCIIRESIALGDRLLVFSQSLITLDLIEQFLQMSQVPGETFNWAKNSSYYRLDGSTSALEREKLINEFNSNPKIHVFLVSTRAGSLGINLIGANRVVVLDASWNPCHDTQAVCRVYRYGQRKPCFVYRLVVDNCLEKKIYDRQINKQGMSDRVVDECNPDAHLTMKDVSTLCWDDKTDDVEEKDWAHVKDNYIDVVLQKVLEKYGRTLNKEPFQHESLLVDRKEKQLSQQEKRLAKKGYEREKQASRQPAYSLMGSARGHRPVASVRPMQQGERPSRWIPAEHWQRQGMTAQEMTLPLDVVIPTNQPEKGNIVLKAGQKVLVLKSPKGVYMQLESGKIVAIKTAIKVKGKADEGGDPTKMVKPPLLPPSIKGNPSLSVVPQKRVVKPFVPGTAKFGVQSVRQSVPNLVSRIKNMQKNIQPGKKMSQNVGCEVPKSFVGGKDDRMPIGSSDDEHKDTPSLLQHLERMKRTPQPPHQESNDDIEKRIALLKKNISIQRVAAKTTAPPTPQQAPAPLPLAPPAQPAIVDEDDEKEESSPEHSGVEQMDHSNSSMLGDSTPFQDTLDSITSAYQATNDENLESYEDDEISEQSDPKHQEQSEISDHSDDVTYVSDQSPTSQYNSQAPNHQQSSSTTTDQPKTENQDYGSYNNYYNYQAPPYHAPPHPQGYGYPQPPPQPYDMMYPPQPQQPQYNYGYQGYPPPPQPHYPPHPPPPQPGYDYSGQAPPPAQPMYGGYNPYPTQYPPPPPTQGMYPPPPTTGPTPQYSEYQQYAPPMNNVAPPPSQYYPNS